MSWGFAIAGSVAGTGIALNYIGGQKSAQAAQDAANAQADQASRNRSEMMGYANAWGEDIKQLSAATPQELNVLGNSYAAANQSLQQQQRLMESIDPSLMEASKQALDILRGGTAAINKPMSDMRAAQRAQLVNSLRSQYGPGAESSSIGQKHLQNFDMQTDGMFQQNQQNSLSQLMGIATNPAPGQNFQRSISGLEEVGQGYANIQNRELTSRFNVGNQTLGALTGIGQQLLQTAGAPYVGAALQGQAMSSMGGSLTQLGAMYGGMSMQGRRSQPQAANGAAPINSAPQAYWVPDAEQASAGTGRYS